MNLATNAYGLIALGVVGIALQMARKNTGPGQKPKDIAARIALFVVVFGFMVYAVPLMFNAGVVHVYKQTQNSAAGDIVGATLNNSAGMVQALVGGQITLPDAETIDSVLPKVEGLPPVAPVAPMAPVQREPEIRQAPPVQRAAAPTADIVVRAWPTAEPVIQSWPVVASAADILPASEPPAPRANETYTVKRGDTMHKIAQALYGDGNQWTYICGANSTINCNDLRAGMVLNLP